MRTMFKRAVCVDGFSMSVQASEHSYCSPKSDSRPLAGKWEDVEVGYPSDPEDLLTPYAENPSKPCDTVYGWVPSTVIAEIVEKHGGLVDDFEPKPWG